MKFILSNILKDYTLATEVKVIDLPVNPLSFILLTMSGFNVTDESTLAEILTFLNKVEIVYKGMTVQSYNSEDLFALNCVINQKSPLLTNMIATDNASRDLTLMVPFGRNIFDPAECFPGTTKGQLQLVLDTTVPATTFDNGILNIQTLELPGASPENFLKITSLNVSAPGAVGNNDIDLPIGNKIVGLLLYSTTGNQAASHTKGIDSARILVDNAEIGYVSGRYMSYQGLNAVKIQTLTRTLAAQGLSPLAHYLYLDYDPVGNGEFLLETEGKSSVKVRMEMGVDEASRVIPVELLPASTVAEI